MTRRGWKAALASVCLLLAGMSAQSAVPYKIVTASERGTYIEIGRDLARFIAPEAGIDLEVLTSAGSAENVHRLRLEPGVKFGLVQSDVYQAFLDQAASGNAGARNLIRPLRVIMPLYLEEIYFVVRADANLDQIHQIRDLRINVGPVGSGTALSASTLYRQMFDKPLPEHQTRFLTNEAALASLVSDKSVDVVVIVAGQPAKLLVDMKPEARALIKLLKLDASRPESQAALKTYFAASAKARSYPNLLTQDVPTFAVKSLLVTYDYTLESTVRHLERFARSLCHNFSRMQIDGHPKWLEVELAMPDLGRGWLYSPPVARQLRQCIGEDESHPTPVFRPKVSPNCSQQNRLLGLCR